MECIRPLYLRSRDLQVPCGRCAFCLATRKVDWSTRIHYEWRKHPGASFVTLTYADAHLVWRSGKPQLHKKHLQDWFKRVRKAGYKFRYYAVGEYGSKTYRPHYHILIFGNVPEKVVQSSWKFGMIHYGRLNQRTVAYALKYTINAKAKFMRLGRIAPWATMSRKPGLGASYLTKAMIEWHRAGTGNFTDYRNYCLVDGKQVHLPRFYKEKIFGKLDRVRIAVRDAKASFERLRARLYKHRNHRNAMEYVADQNRIAARRILSSSRKNLTI